MTYQQRRVPCARIKASSAAVGSLFGAHIRAAHPDLLRDSNFLLPPSGSNSFDAERVRVSFCMSRFGERQNPCWRPLDGRRSYRLVVDEIGQETCPPHSEAIATSVAFTHPSDTGTVPCRLPRTPYLGSLHDCWWEGLLSPVIGEHSARRAAFSER
jgi:hypothetical protein